MDNKKIGKFLRDLRREHNLTQEELGEKLGATNKTISRWETGTYLPPADILLQMSNLYDVSVNEILSGERLATADYQPKAEENIVTSINDTSFANKRSKKILIICLSVILALAIASAIIIYCTTHFNADKNTYIYVTFDSNGGSDVQQYVITIRQKKDNVKYGVNIPPYPTKSGYSFVGWFVGNDEQAKRWDFYRDSVTSDITLYAKWEPATDGIEYEEVGFGVYAVVGCGRWTDKLITDENVIIPSYYNGYPVVWINNSAFANLSTMRSVVIPDTVTRIDDYAFCDCYNLTNIQFGNGVKDIREKAFTYCLSLRNINLPQSLETIGKSAFESCSNLQSVIIPDNVKSIKERAFANCLGLASITLGVNIKSIDLTAFQDCDNLLEVHDMCKFLNAIDNPQWFPNAIGVYKNDLETTKLSWVDEDFLFYDIDGAEPQLLKYYGNESIVTLPSTSLGETTYALRQRCFADSKVAEVIISSNVKSIGPHAFEYSRNLNKVTIQDGVTEIGDYAFRMCDSLEQINFADTISQIGSFAFEDCKSLQSIVLPEAVTSISMYTFSDCKSIRAVSFPSQLVSIESGAFSGCVSLREIRLPSSIKIFVSPFSNCPLLETIEVYGDGGEYYSENNCLINAESKELVLGCMSTVIPTDGSVTTIGYNAFQDCHKLYRINIPASITQISEGAFSNCMLLREITVDEANTAYEVSGNCLISTADRKLIALIPGVIPEDVNITSIGAFVLTDPAIKRVEVPKSVIYIDFRAFYIDRNNEVRLIYDGTMKECAENTEYGKDVTKLYNVSCIQCTDGELYRRWVE